MKQEIRWALVLGVVCSARAFAQDEVVDEETAPRAAWSVQSGRTVGAGATVIQGQMGFPGISATLLHGLSRNVDIGGRFSFNYGFEGQTSIITPGLKFQFIARIGIVDKGRFNFGIRAEPGLYMYFISGLTGFPQRGAGTHVGLAMPIGLDFGIRVSDPLMVNLNFELPLVAQLTSPPYFAVPVLFGGGAEYKVDRNLALTFNTRFGPYIYTASGNATFALNLLFGIAYRF
ncbi:MAG: hypothetical protein ACT4TC_03955 [Myxococcaceae bacterium]